MHWALVICTDLVTNQSLVVQESIWTAGIFDCKPSTHQGCKPLSVYSRPWWPRFLPTPALKVQFPLWLSRCCIPTSFFEHEPQQSAAVFASKWMAVIFNAGPANVLPRPALPKFFTDEILKHLPNSIFGSNPCRCVAELHQELDPGFSVSLLHSKGQVACLLLLPEMWHRIRVWISL